MLDADIGIVGGGLAGSMAAAMLGRAGLSTILIDIHQVYPPDFRCEKIDEGQLALLAKTGLADELLKSATPIDELWIARYGHLVAKRANNQVGIRYDDLVNAARALIPLIPRESRFIRARATAISTGPAEQIITISDGRKISVRLVVLATGPNNGLRQSLNIAREDLSKCHSISIGFDAEPAGGGRFQFPALTYFGEQPGSRIGYITLFPIDSTMRANLFVYGDMRDPWLRELRRTPEATLLSSMPNLRKLTGDFRLTSEIQIRPVDLYVTSGYRQPGVVLVGDAFATSCPAAGTGTTKIFTDVERLCNVYIPRWLESDGMEAGKIAEFYNDPAKTECDAFCVSLAYYMRSLAVRKELRWRVRRVGWCFIDFTKSALRRPRAQLGFPKEVVQT